MDKKIIKMLSTTGFCDRFTTHTKTTKTYKEAYERTETEFTNVFGRPKYSSYDSFRVVKNRLLKSKVKKRN